MKVERLVHHLRAGATDAKDLHVAGLSLGDELVRGRLDVLQQALAALARLRMPEDSFAAGYAAALADVTAGYEATAAEQADVSESADLLLRAGVRDVISALHDGVELPSAIAERIGKPRETISRTLALMREAGLAQDYDPPPGSDQRQRPHSLTPRGQRIAEKLPPLFSEDAGRSLMFAIHVFGRLARLGSIGRPKLAELAQKDFGHDSIGQIAAERFVEAACTESILIREEDSLRLLPTRSDMDMALHDILTEAMNTKHSKFVQHMYTLVGQDRHLVVRSKARSQEWGVLLATTDLFGRSQMFNCPDLDLDAVKRLESFVVLYDDAEECCEYSRSEQIASELAKAARQVCIVRGPEELPPRVERWTPSGLVL